MASIKQLLTKVQKSYGDKTDTVKRLRRELKALERAGIDYGTPTYKNKRYLRIVRPAVDGQPRQFEYVGADPSRQRAALTALERGKQYDALSAEIQDLENALFSIQAILNQAVNELEWSHDHAGRRAAL